MTTRDRLAEQAERHLLNGEFREAYEAYDVLGDLLEEIEAPNTIAVRNAARLARVAAAAEARFPILRRTIQWTDVALVPGGHAGRWYSRLMTHWIVELPGTNAVAKATLHRRRVRFTNASEVATALKRVRQRMREGD